MMFSFRGGWSTSMGIDNGRREATGVRPDA
jgi:hypothetical protein